MNIMGGINDFAQQIEEGKRQLAIAHGIKTAMFKALTEREQINLSTKIMGDLNLLPNMLVAWVGTEEGKAAVRALVDKFTGHVVQP